MGRGSIYHVEGVDIPWVGGRYSMDKWVEIPWVGVIIPWVGGSKYHG